MPLLWKIALNALPGAVATTAEADTGPVRVGAAFVSLSSLGGVGRALSSAVGFYRRVGRAVSTSLAWTAPVGAAVLARAALLAHDPVGRSFRSVAVFGPAAEVVVNSCSATVDGELLGVIGLTISGDEGQYCWTLSATLATAGDWRACTPGAELVVTVNGFSWGFLVDAPGRSSRFGALAYTVSARSHTSRMDGEYADTVSKTWAASARSIAQEMCDANGISLDWRLPDWTLSEFSVDGETALGVIKALAASPEFRINTTPDGKTLIVRPDYPVPVPDYWQATPTMELSDLDDIVTAESSLVSRPGYNRVRVMDAEPDTGVEFVLQDLAASGLTAYQRCLALYSAPFTILTLCTSGDADSVTITDEGTITEEREEVVEFVQGEAGVSDYVDELLGVEWLYADLGGVTADRASLTAEASGQSLARVTYQVRYQRFLVASARLEEVQFYAEWDA